MPDRIPEPAPHRLTSIAAMVSADSSSRAGEPTGEPKQNCLQTACCLAVSKTVSVVRRIEGSNPSPSAFHAGSGGSANPDPPCGGFLDPPRPSTEVHRDTEKCTGLGAHWRTSGERSHHHSLSSKTKQRYHRARSALLSREKACLSAALFGRAPGVPEHLLQHLAVERAETSRNGDRQERTERSRMETGEEPRAPRRPGMLAQPFTTSCGDESAVQPSSAPARSGRGSVSLC